MIIEYSILFHDLILFPMAYIYYWSQLINMKDKTMIGNTIISGDLHVDQVESETGGVQSQVLLDFDIHLDLSVIL